MVCAACFSFFSGGGSCPLDKQSLFAYNRGRMKIQRLKLKKLNNTRDLRGIPAAGGRALKAGKLFRSGRLSRLPQRTKTAL